MSMKKQVKKKLTLILERCWSCPFMHADINETKWLCRKNGDEFIAWQDENEMDVPIPKWCPLPDTKQEADE